ncbi:nucleoside-diphosphate kinase [Dactylosporangium sp. NPDC050588]|uniref:nucleoside-diphosphate kinase n=1 Tax=Dactylosporangium sp. NPDC050588 TaxID=3157211 RepID=UPI0033DAB6B0
MSTQPAAFAAVPGAAAVAWRDWTVVLLKPDCLRRNLAAQVLFWISGLVDLVDVRQVQPTEQQIFAHYDDMLPLSDELGRDVPAELRRIFVGNTVIVALGHGPGAAGRVRALVGPTDPAIAPADTIRGRFADDTLAQAMADGRLVDNVIHTSDHAAAAHRDFAIWYGPTFAHLLDPTPASVPAPGGGTP